MTTTGTTELIWHFAGYLRIPDFDYGTPTIRYDGQPTGPAPGEQSDTPAHHVRLVDAYHLPSVHLGAVNLADAPADGGHFHPIRLFSSISHSHVHPPHPHAYHMPPPQLPQVSGGAGFGGQLVVTATYHSGGDQELIDIRQINSMVSNNIYSSHAINAPPPEFYWNENHADNAMGQLIGTAAEAPGHDLLPVGANTQQLISYVNAHDADPASTHAQMAPYEINPGVYVDGAVHTGSPDPHQVTNDAMTTVSTALNNGLSGPPAAPTGDGHDLSQQTVTVGSNIAANSATLVNVDGANVSLVVMGNYYQLQGIVQTNVFGESDHVYGSNASHADISIAPNTVTNIADIQENSPLLTSSSSGSMPSELNWNVTVLHGSLYDVHSLVQTNYITNNNVVNESTQVGISEVLAGGNTAVNAANFQSLGASYDLIIVEGNYHQDNLINQTNVMLDSNNIGLTGDGTASQTVTGGGNTVINDASIVNYGNYTFQALNSSAESVIQSLEHQQSTISPTDIANGFQGLLGNLNVLVVTGDYYDVNYVSQTNFISNGNTVGMTGSQGGLSSASQTVQTGHDMAVNAATIVDAGSAMSPYLGGQYSQDLILIQTNIVADGTKIVGSDPSQLASELVAFTGTNDPTAALDHSASSSPTLDLQHHASDPMASLLH
mgnify:CR=1 FL=1